MLDAASHEPVEKLVLWSWRDRGVLGISDSAGKIVIDGMLPGKFEFNVGQGQSEMLGGMRGYFHGTLGRWWSADAVNEWDRKSIRPDGFQRNFDNLSFDLASGMQPVVIEVEQGVTFSGHVYDPDGQPVAGATVAPAKTGSGNSLTGDTRYSVKTDKDGAYRVVMPASNQSSYNLIAHDGDYQEWRQWANGVTDPLRTRPGQQLADFDLKLTRPATVRGRVIAGPDKALVDVKVRAAAADLRENRYYVPTVKVNRDGTFELKFIRPGKQDIQVSPFWLSPGQAPAGTSHLVELAEGEVLEGVELQATQQAALPAGGDVVVEFAPQPAAAADAANPKSYVTGLVTEKETGKPIAGVEISLFVDGEQDPAKRTLKGATDDAGRYRIEVPLGSVRLRHITLQPGYWLARLDQQAGLATSRENPIATHDIAVNSGPTWPIRFVAGEGAQPLERVVAHVFEIEDDATRQDLVTGKQNSWTAQSSSDALLDADGRGLLTQCGQSGKLWISLQGASAEMVVPPGFDVTKVKAIEPVAGTSQISIVDAAGLKATIDHAEAMLVDGLPLLTFHAPRSPSPPQPLQTQAFSGRVVDLAGKPIAEARVGVVLGQKGTGSYDTRRAVTTDADGRFVLEEAFTAGDTEAVLVLVINKQGFAGIDSRRIEFPAKAAPTIDLGQFFLRAGQTLPIHVVDENNQPLSGAVIQPGGGYAQWRQEMRTDADGRAVLRDLPSGVVRVSASYGDRSRSTQLFVSAKPSENVEVTLRLLAVAEEPPAQPVKTAPPLAVGDQAPEWALNGWSDGQIRTLADLRGHVVVLDFWGMWCPGCVEEIPELQKLAEKYAKQGVVFIGIHTANGDMDQIKKLQQSKGWTAPTALDASGETISRYRIDGYPSLLIIGADGKIVFNENAHSSPHSSAASFARRPRPRVSLGRKASRSSATIGWRCAKNSFSSSAAPRSTKPWLGSCRWAIACAKFPWTGAHHLSRTVLAFGSQPPGLQSGADQKDQKRHADRRVQFRIVGTRCQRRADRQPRRALGQGGNHVEEKGQRIADRGDIFRRVSERVLLFRQSRDPQHGQRDDGQDVPRTDFVAVMKDEQACHAGENRHRNIELSDSLLRADFLKAHRRPRSPR